MRDFKMMVYYWTFLIVCLQLPFIQATICNGQENEHQPPEPCFEVSFYNYTVDRQAALGSELVLECYISYKSTYTVLWSHNGRVVAINDKVISPAETKLRVDSDSERRFNLVLSELDAAKNGTYECSVVSKTYPTLKYSVEVLVPPQINRSPSGDEIVVDEGGSLLVQCLTSGNPKPELTFSRHHGEKGKHTTIDVDNASMKLVNVDQTYAGQYSCIASNGVGLGATSEFNVFVRFKPRVTFVDNIQNVLYTSLGKQEQIKCIVDGYPRPVISLLQNGSPVSEQLYSLDRNNEVKDQYVLTYSFFGSAETIDYECIAKNDLGNTVAFLKVTPQVSAIKLSNSDLTYSDAVVFEWSLFSGSAPNELNVQVFTENSSTNFTTESKQMKPIALVDSEDVTSLSSIAIYHSENHISYKGYLDVIKLTPNTTYTIRLRVRNELTEWSDWSHNLTARTSSDESNRITLTKHRSLHNHYRMMHHDKKHKHYQLSGSRDLNGGKRDNYNPNMFENHASKPLLSPLVSIVASFFIFIKLFF